MIICAFGVAFIYFIAYSVLLIALNSDYIYFSIFWFLLNWFSLYKIWNNGSALFENTFWILNIYLIQSIIYCAVLFIFIANNNLFMVITGVISQLFSIIMYFYIWKYSKETLPDTHSRGQGQCRLYPQPISDSTLQALCL